MDTYVGSAQLAPIPTTIMHAVPFADDVSTELGQSLHLDRQIRIIQNPLQVALDKHMSGNRSESSEDNDDDQLPCCRAECGNLYAPQLFGEFEQRQLHEAERQQLLGNGPIGGGDQIWNVPPPLEGSYQYDILLRRAHLEDLTEVSGIGCIYLSGTDRLGRPVVVFCGKWFPANDIDMDKVLLYLIKLLDPIVNGDYVVAYFHTLVAKRNHLPMQWMRKVYNFLPYRYKKNLKAFYIVHPSIWTKTMAWWFTTFMASAIKAKVHSLSGLEYIYSAIAKDQLEIPAYILEYDMTNNGLHYFNY